MLLFWIGLLSPLHIRPTLGYDGLQLKEWWKKHGRGVVAKNIRHSLGGTEVNNQIKQTAVGSPEKFWYFNNGITLVADDAVKAPANASSRSAGVFSFKGASIVNGAQTVSSLGKIDGDASLGSVRVPIRVILLKTAPLGFGGDVARTNNFQNRIEPRDFVAQDPEQSRLRQEMAIEGIGLPVCSQRRDNTDSYFMRTHRSDDSFGLRVRGPGPCCSSKGRNREVLR